MILRRLRLENFGLFRGVHEFNLSPAADGRNIILFGGKNGSGKTTLLEAVRLCLYGPAAIGRPSVAAYHEHLASRLHKSKHAVLSAAHASVEMELEIQEDGRPVRLEVGREWERSGDRMNERLNVRRDGRAPDGLAPSLWQDFLRELLPPGISQFFFFDGERVASLAQDTDHEEFRSAVRSLLGLDLVERLQADLRTFSAKRLVPHAGESEKASGLAALDADMRRLEDLLHSLRQEEAQVRQEIDFAETQVAKQEEMLRANGGVFAAERNCLQGRRTQLDGEIASVESRIRELAGGLLPFAVAPSLCADLRDRLAEEGDLQDRIAAARLIDRKVRQLGQDVLGTQFWGDLGLPRAMVKKVGRRIETALANLRDGLKPGAKQRVIHIISPAERAHLLSALDRILKEIPAVSARLGREYEKLVRERQAIEKALARAPEDDLVLPQLQELRSQHERVGALRARLAALEESKRKAEYDHSELERRRRRVVSEIDRDATRLNQRLLIEKVGTVLLKFHAEVLQDRIDEIRDAIKTRFNSLCRKGALLEAVHIDPVTFDVRLTTAGDMAREALSAGENQIFAIAILWSLATVAGRSLPVIIDTPLGRLDHDHRMNLVKHYFPNVSHQVILLSTDSEIDEAYFEQLRPSIAAVYHLSYDRAEGATVASQGYFWPTSQEAVQCA